MISSTDALFFNRSFLSAMMMFEMFRPGHNFKVFYSIIHSIFVFMVNNFALEKLPSKVLLHDQSVDQGLYSVYPFRMITTAKDCARSAWSVFKTKWISCCFKPSAMFNAITFRVMLFITFFDSTFFIINSFCHNEDIIQIKLGIN